MSSFTNHNSKKVEPTMDKINNADTTTVVLGQKWTKKKNRNVTIKVLSN